MLSEKLSGDVYTSKDMHLLTTFSYQVNTAIGRAHLHRRVQQYSRDLEKKVKQRTKELEVAYAQQRHMTQEISHSLQTPLTVLKGELSNLRIQDVPEIRLSVMERVVDDISTFVHRFLQLAQLESQAVMFPLTRIHLDALLAEIVEYITIVAEQHRIDMSFMCTEEVYICGNNKKIEELVQNIIGNAIKYMGTKEPRLIQVALSTDVQNAIITISDTGIGIAPEKLKKVFHRFYREDHQSTASGFGLGLAMSKAIVAKMNGTIRMESVLGEGTTCTITFPLV